MKNRLTINHEMLTGRSTEHLVALNEHHRLQPEAAAAFTAMQLKASQAGFNLQPASTFRDFDRQLAIWNGKFRGQRPVLDKNSQPVDISHLDDAQRGELILRWSSMPGASRHHWGSDLDIYDPSLLPEGKSLQLEPWEYEPEGYFHALTLWLDAHLDAFGFYRPFDKDRDGVAIEPWHLSYRPLAAEYEKRVTPEVLTESWQGRDVAGVEWVIENLATIYPRFIRNTQD